MFTNAILQHRGPGGPPNALSTGAASFKRMLGGERKSLLDEEETSLVKESDDAHLMLLHLIHQPKWIDQQLSQSGIADFGNDAATFAKSV
jgi:hypothetical protein